MEWKPVIGDDSLVCQRENENEYDENVVAIYHDNLIRRSIVGHVSFMFSEVFNIPR